MAGIPFGALAGGVSQGLEQGQQMRARQIAIQDELRQRSAQEAAANWLQSLGQMPDAGAPTAVPAQPPAGPMPAVPGAPGPPMAGGPAPGGPPQAVPMPGAQPMPTAPQTPPGQVPPMLQAPGAAPSAAAPGGAPPPAPGMSGTAQPTGDIWADSKKTIQSISKGLMQANPGRKWRPGEFMDAVNDSIKVMEGVNPMEKIAAQAQIAGAKAQYEYWHSNQVHEDKSAFLAERTDRDKNTTADRKAAIDASLKRAKLTSDTRLKAQAMADATRLQAADITQSGANERANKLLDYRQQALEEGLDLKQWQTQVTAALRETGMDDAFINKVFSAQAGAGQAGTPPARPATKPLPAVPARGASRQAPAAAGKAKPIPAETLAQWAQVPAQNKAAAKKHLADQGYDVSGLR